MRFNSIGVDQGATILKATIQFQTDETRAEVTSLTIRGEDSDNATTFLESNNNITLRPQTGASVPWSPTPWTVVGEAGSAQQTPNFASVIQEIVDRPGWSNGNSLVVLIDGTGKRTAESYNGIASSAPLLHLEFIVNQAPVAEDDTGFMVEVGATLGQGPGTLFNDNGFGLDVLGIPQGSIATFGPTTGSETVVGFLGDTSLEAGVLTVEADGSFNFSPTVVGTHTFVYTLDNGVSSDTATVIIDVQVP